MGKLIFVEKFMCIGLLASPITLLETKIENMKAHVKTMDQNLTDAQTENKQLCDAISSYSIKQTCQDQLLAMKDKLIQLLEKHQK